MVALVVSSFACSKKVWYEDHVTPKPSLRLDRRRVSDLQHRTTIVYAGRSHFLYRLRMALCIILLLGQLPESHFRLFFLSKTMCRFRGWPLLLAIQTRTGAFSCAVLVEWTRKLPNWQSNIMIPSCGTVKERTPRPLILATTKFPNQGPQRGRGRITVDASHAHLFGIVTHAYRLNDFYVAQSRIFRST